MNVVAMETEACGKWALRSHTEMEGWRKQRTERENERRVKAHKEQGRDKY